MAFLERSLKSIAHHSLSVLFKVRAFLIGLFVVGLGVLLGHLLCSPDSAELTVSFLAVAVVMLMVVARPLNGVLTWLLLEPFIESWVNIPMGAGLLKVNMM